jgi:aspartate aminotransferase
MLATSRTALRQAATKQFTVKAGARAVSAWSSVPQGPPVSQWRLSFNHAGKALTT